MNNIMNKVKEKIKARFLVKIKSKNKKLIQ
jgi:hypothetical protein